MFKNIIFILCIDYLNFLIRIWGNSIYVEDIVFLNNNCFEKEDDYFRRYKISS